MKASLELSVTTRQKSDITENVKGDLVVNVLTIRTVKLNCKWEIPQINQRSIHFCKGEAILTSLIRGIPSF